MILVYDDTFTMRANDYSIGFTKESKYASLISIVQELSEDEIEREAGRILSAKVVACHKTIKFRSASTKEYLPPEKNSQLFESLEKVIRKAQTIYISFSGQIPETSLGGDKYVAMNKRDFYSNLKDFIDVYLETGEFASKVLKFGKNFTSNEVLSIQGNLLYIFNNQPNSQTVQELFDNDKRAVIELKEFNSISKIRPNDEEWIALIMKDHSELSKLKELLSKITKSFMKYGKCIYNI